MTTPREPQPLGKARLLALLACVLAGGAAGVGLFTFGYADGASYLTNDPQACANCHVMQPHLDAWVKSSHGKFAVCNDCHAPRTSYAAKYYCKARNGFFHSLAFTTGGFPDEIQMHAYNRGVVEANCRRCHAELTHAIDPDPKPGGAIESTSCLHCHRTVGHDT
ncbi:MAG: cytochrome c nitrite reductase small subunit [Pirellulales bacterium]|nr:cytochrome c nitrite reductase small subunit [Pirellulales bacterium]